jgi:hypothetical protein
MPRKTDSPSIKEALTNRDISDIRADISSLATTVAKGFEGIHLRQDTTNGKVLKAGSDIIENKSQVELQMAALKAQFEYNRFIWYVTTICVSIIIALASYILLNQH